MNHFFNDHPDISNLVDSLETEIPIELLDSFSVDQNRAFDIAVKTALLLSAAIIFIWIFIDLKIVTLLMLCFLTGLISVAMYRHIKINSYYRILKAIEQHIERYAVQREISETS